jgi:hypothetical protein
MDGKTVKRMLHHLKLRYGWGKAEVSRRLGIRPETMSRWQHEGCSLAGGLALKGLFYGVDKWPLPGGDQASSTEGNPKSEGS